MANANRDKGLRTERFIAVYFKAHGLLGAKRLVTTGWRTAHNLDPDQGDIKGVPGICVQAKDVRGTGPLTGRALANAMKDVLDQCVASGAVVPWLIERRGGHADVGSWWSWMPNGVYGAVMFGIDPARVRLSNHPVRTEVRDVIDNIVRVSRLCEKAA